MMTKEGSINIANLVSPGTLIPVLRRDQITTNGYCIKGYNTVFLYQFLFLFIVVLFFFRGDCTCMCIC